MIKSFVREKADNWDSCNKNALYDKIDSVEYVSFDIFDTLLKRDVEKPTDVFEIVGELCGVSDFKEKRIRAEKKAREQSLSGEITLDEIYEVYDSKETELLKKTEIECEINLSTVNRNMLKVFQYCKENKKVILVSDMYLPKEVIEKLLEKNKIADYQKLYVSNEFGKTKADGSLFEFVCRDIGIKPDKLLHIGNSFKADYIMSKKKKVKSVKVATYANRLQREYENVLQADDFHNRCMNAFLNNHTYGKNSYYKFGYEVFGPLLYGFTDWLLRELKENDFEQVFFLARDGYIMKKLYDGLGYNKIVPSVYFEVSRRSLRVPSFYQEQSYEDIVRELTVPNMTNITQIFDSIGLEAEDYKDVILKNKIAFDEQLKRDRLVDNHNFRKVFEAVKENLYANAKEERKNLLKYIGQFDFSKKTAMVDIGWGGSMQKYLFQALDSIGIQYNIEGYYVGLTLKSRENLKEAGYKAKGYAFDCLNNENDEELESSYIGLIETLFLEQKGSVKRYYDEGSKVVAERYQYEYLTEEGLMREAVNVKQIQKGALAFAKDYNDSILKKIIKSDNSVMYNNMHAVGMSPVSVNIRQFGDFSYFNCGDKVYLASPHNLLYYMVHAKELKRDIYDSQWKIGFMKAMLKLNLPYDKIFAVLRKEANR